MRRSGPVAAVGVVLAVALGLAGCGGGGKPSRSRTPSDLDPSRNAPLEHVTHRSHLLTIMQDDGLLGIDPAGTVRTMARDYGATTIRTIAYWTAFAPDATSHTRPAGFDATDPADYAPKVWRVLDAADRAAVANHVTLYVTLDGLAPDWATGPGKPKGVRVNAWKVSAHDYAQWVEAMGRRYSGTYTPKGQSSPLPRIHFWSIWNEPNFGANNSPPATHHGRRATGAAQYRTLLNAGWRALAATGHTPATDTILIGETAPRGSLVVTLPAEMLMPLRFIRTLYCVSTKFKPLRGIAASHIGCPTTEAGTRAFVADNPALFRATGWADHPYPTAQSPDTTTQPLGVHGYADFANLGGLMNTLDRVTAAYGQDIKLPIYSTEFDYQTGPLAPDPSLSQSDAEIWMNEAEYLTWRNPRIRSYDQYLIDDPTPSTSHFDGGLATYQGVAKLQLYGFQMPLWMPRTRAPKGTPLEVWGCARPAPQLERRTGQPQSVQIQLSTDGGSTFRTIRTVTLDPARDGCYIDEKVVFPSSGLVRINWPAGQHYSRFQRIRLT